jgi:hypothetical protein
MHTGPINQGTDGLWVAVLCATVALLVHQFFDATVLSFHTGYGLIALLALGVGRRA